MAKNVVGLFDTMNDAEAAVRDLRSAGFSGGDISLVANNADNRYNMDDTSYDSTATNSEAGEGAGVGATGGAVLGGLAGLLVGLGALVIPGIGPVIAAGTLATALGSAALGAGLGAAAGGLVGALVGAGIPEEDAHVYSEGIRRGGALVSVQVSTDDDADRAANIMDSHNVVDIDERGSSFRQGGWSRFDENADPYSTTSGSYASSGDADRNVGSDDYDRSSKVGTAGGGLAGAATGAAIGSAGGPVGAVVGGIAGAVTGGAVGAAGDAAGAEATDNDANRTSGYDTTNRSGTAYGSATTNYDTTSGSTFDTTRTDYTTTNTGMSSTNLDQGGEVKIPIVEEELRVGKREVEQGGVRVNTRVEETPVNEQVTLREETVDVHRKPVDRPVSDADVANFQEGTFEVRERAEEAVVDKQARVVEEVHIKKNVEERTENIQDTVRRTDVDVDQISGQRTVGSTDVNYTDTTSTTGYNTTGTTGTSNEGIIERGASKLGNAAEGATGADLDRDGDVGQRDPRNNY
jgi:uncharacterized protein (TIGR02271 family)